MRTVQYLYSQNNVFGLNENQREIIVNKKCNGIEKREQGVMRSETLILNR